MSSFHNFKNNVAITAANDINTICQPFLQNTPLTFFSYTRHYKNNSRFMLCNNAYWMEKYFKLQYYNLTTFNIDCHQQDIIYLIWDNWVYDHRLSYSKIAFDAKNNFDIAHGITILKASSSWVDAFQFGTSNKNHLTGNFYFNHIEFFENFILHFFHTAEKILKTSTKNMFQTAPVKNVSNYSDDIVSTLKNSTQKKLKTNYLSSRELDCINWLTQGKKTPEIAYILGLSKRTIEKHIYNIKQKLDCTSLFQVGHKIAQIKQ